MNEFNRLQLLIGEDGLAKLKQSSVAVFGIGGVGSYVVEALTRSGIGSIAIIDKDVIDITNINRQLIATHSTIGKRKVDVTRDRISDINPECKVQGYHVFYNEETMNAIDLRDYDYIVDAIDTVTSKILIVKQAKEFNIRVISCMGTGNKLDPKRLEIADIKETSVCPLARVMRKAMKDSGINNLKVLYSREKPLSPVQDFTEDNSSRRQIPGSSAFVPSVAGLIIASEVIKDIISK